MKVFIGLVSSNDAALALVSNEQAKLLAEEWRRDARFIVAGASISIGVFNPKDNSETLSDFAYKRSNGTDISALLIDSELRASVDSVSPAMLLGQIQLGGDPAKLRNPMEAAFNRILKNLLEVHALMSNEKNLQVLLLPKRNFIAEELDQLIEIGKADGLCADFINRISAKLGELRKRKLPRPRAKVNPKKQYLVDDDNKFFEYGFENHSRFETGEPHLKSCILAGRYRLGAKIPNEYRHYNVSKPRGDSTRITGEYPNCHCDMKKVDHTHINMFANDYH